MADTAQLRDFRAALDQAYRKADNAVTAAWRAHRRAIDLASAADVLAGSIGNEGLRSAIQATAAKMQQDAMQAENAASQRRSEIGELLDLLGGATAR